MRFTTFVPPSRDWPPPLEAMPSTHTAARGALPHVVYVLVTVVLFACSREGPTAGSTASSGSSRVGALAPASSAPAEAPASGGVRFRPRTYAIGHTERLVSHQSLELSVEFLEDGQRAHAQEQRRSEESVRRIEVLELVGRRPGKVRVTYERYAVEARGWAQPPPGALPLQGQTFVVDATGPSPSVVAASGRVLGGPERAAVLAQHAWVGKEDPLIEALGTDPVPLGEERRMTPQLQRALLHGASGELKGGHFVLTLAPEEAGRRVAVLAWKLRLETTELEGDMKLSWEVEGKARLGIDPAMTLATEASAQIGVSGRHRQQERRFDLEGVGSMQDRMTSTAVDPAPSAPQR